MGMITLCLLLLLTRENRQYPESSDLAKCHDLFTRSLCLFIQSLNKVYLCNVNNLRFYGRFYEFCGLWRAAHLCLTPWGAVTSFSWLFLELIQVYLFIHSMSFIWPPNCYEWNMVNCYFLPSCHAQSQSHLVIAVPSVSVQIFISNPFAEVKQLPETTIQNSTTLKANAVLIMEKPRTGGQGENQGCWGR